MIVVTVLSRLVATACVVWALTLDRLTEGHEAGLRETLTSAGEGGTTST